MASLTDDFLSWLRGALVGMMPAKKAFKLRDPDDHSGRTRLLRRYDGAEVRTFDSEELGSLETQWRSKHRLFLSGGPIPIDCERERINLFAVFLNHQTGSRLRTDRAGLAALAERFGASMADWLGGVDFALVLYRDDDNTGHALNTPLGVVSGGRDLIQHNELVNSILSHEDVRRRGIRAADLGSFVLERTDAGLSVREVIVSTERHATQTPIHQALLGYGGAASLLAFVLSSLALWRHWDGLIGISVVAALTALLLRFMGTPRKA